MSKSSKLTTNGAYQPTTAADWRKPREEGEVVPLPSGNRARLRPADLLQMIKAGTIPDLLSPIAAGAVWKEQDPEKIGDSVEMAMQYHDLMAIVLPAIFVEPKVAAQGTEPGPDEIAIEDIDLSDRTLAFNLAIAGVGTMRQFRAEQIKRMESVPNGENVQSEAE